MAELDNSFSEVISGAIATGVTDGLRRCGLILIDEQEPERCQPGRPFIKLDMEDVEFLRRFHFTWTQIANVLGVSRSTLYRRIEQEGLNWDTTFADISDTELDIRIDQLKKIHSNDGERLIIGHLRSQGIYVPRSRIRASIHRIDPVNTAIRRRVTIRRRVYHCDGPNSVWHIDGHHKLIRWRFITHGGIDGYSRSIVYLRCSGNNRATTMLHAFIEAIGNYGVPEKVRTDRGGENTEVWRYMIDNHQSDRAVIVGSSTHNERIERLWRDVQRCVGSIFCSIFRELEGSERLDPLNEVDLYCLHRVFLPRINATLDAFVESWNNHPVSTEGNMSPNQLFIHGVLQQDSFYNNPYDPTTSTTNVPNPNEDVSVPSVTFRPCRQLEQQLRLVDPLTPSNNRGCDIYYLVTDIVGRHLSNGCNHC